MRAALALIALAAGCTSAYRGSAHPFSPSALSRDAGWTSVAEVPVLRQEAELDCGPTAAAMMLAYWGRAASPASLRLAPGHGLQAGTLRDLLRARGLEVYLVEGGLDDLERELGEGRPVLVGLAKPYQNGIYAHYEIVAGVNRARGLIATIDPASGWQEDTVTGFMREWRPTHHLTLVVSPAEPSAGKPTARNH
jgi:hypothetical protein